MTAPDTQRTDAEWRAILDKLDQIKALRDRAGTQAEAEAAAAALTRLLTKYNLSITEFEMRTKGDDTLGSNYVRTDITIENGANWRKDLLHVVATENGCRAIFKRGSSGVIMVGSPTGIGIVTDIYQEFVALAEVMARRASREPAYAIDVVAIGARRWRTGYLIGFAQGIWEAMRDARKAAVDETAGGSALVIVQDKALARAVDDLVGKTVSAGKSNVSRDAYNAGRSDGRGAMTKRIG